MSYGRNPNYIWSDGDYINFNTIRVPEEVINAFLFKVLLTNCREELKERLIQGKESWLHREILVNRITGAEPFSKEDYRNPYDLAFKEVSQDNEDLLMEKKWMEEQEDEIIKKLMSINTKWDFYVIRKEI